MFTFKVSRKTVGAMMMAGGLMYLLSPIGTNSVPAPGGTGGVPSNGLTYKWAAGDILRSHGYAGVSWRVLYTNYPSATYTVEFTEPGKVSNIVVDASNLESADIYKVN